jgi:hypothetical protein
MLLVWILSEDVGPHGTLGRNNPRDNTGVFTAKCRPSEDLAGRARRRDAVDGHESGRRQLQPD